MKSLKFQFILFFLLMLSTATSWSQDDFLSPKLGKEDGLPGLSINQIIPQKKGFTEIDRTVSKANFFESEYMATKVYEVDPVMLGYTDVFGLKVERIEVLGAEDYTDDGETMVFRVNEIAVFLTLPINDKILSSFIDKFTTSYAPRLDVSGFTEGGVVLMQWLSTTDCGAMMSLPQLYTLRDYKESGLNHVEICFTNSCGG